MVRGTVDGGFRVKGLCGEGAGDVHQEEMNFWGSGWVYPETVGTGQGPDRRPTVRTLTPLQPPAHTQQ